jgi:hypothetical protein
MSPVIKEYIARLRMDPLFQQWAKEISEARPVVPSYVPGTPEETQTLVEQIKFDTGRRDGFDLAMLHITGGRNER